MLCFNFSSGDWMFSLPWLIDPNNAMGLFDDAWIAPIEAANVLNGVAACTVIAGTSAAATVRAINPRIGLRIITILS
jgi:hypothetical protein